MNDGSSSILMLPGEVSLGQGPIQSSAGPSFWAIKRACDVALGVFFLPLLCLLAGILVLVNPLFNRGPLVFSQLRMGRNENAFRIYKFRTMTVTDTASRSYACPLEIERITQLGHLLRRTRVDELPQVLNVLRGEMSFIGPRPHAYDHAVAYAALMPQYRLRYQVRPGISGLAQVHMGYAEGPKATRTSARMDLIYVKRACLKLELSILLRTVFVVVTGKGAR